MIKLIFIITSNNYNIANNNIVNNSHKNDNSDL